MFLDREQSKMCTSYFKCQECKVSHQSIFITKAFNGPSGWGGNDVLFFYFLLHQNLFHILLLNTSEVDLSCYETYINSFFSVSLLLIVIWKSSSYLLSCWRRTMWVHVNVLINTLHPKMIWEKKASDVMSSNAAKVIPFKMDIFWTNTLLPKKL